MTVILIILSALVVVGVVLYIHHRLTSSVDAVEEQSKPQPPTECCGLHITCEKDSLLSSVSDEIVYYDDEELDIYKGREADCYNEEEIERFRDILLTLLPQDIAGWGRSVQLRGIELPTAVRDELLMIVSEARQKENTHD